MNLTQPSKEKIQHESNEQISPLRVFFAHATVILIGLQPPIPAFVLIKIDTHWSFIVQLVSFNKYMGDIHALQTRHD